MLSNALPATVSPRPSLNVRAARPCRPTRAAATIYLADRAFLVTAGGARVERGRVAAGAADTDRLCQQVAGYATLSGRSAVTLNDVQGALDDARVRLSALEQYLDAVQLRRT